MQLPSVTRPFFSSLSGKNLVPAPSVKHRFGTYHRQLWSVLMNMVLHNSPWLRYHLSLVKELVSVDRHPHLGGDHMAVGANRPKRPKCEELLSIPRENSSAA